jgi:hypothetical protein
MASGNSGFSSKSLGVRVQKKIASKFSNKTLVKNLVDDDMGQLLDMLHDILLKEYGEQKAEKVIKNILKIVIKIAILVKNDQFNSDEIAIGMQLRKKLRNSALTVISFHDVDFSYDSTFLINLVNEIGDLLHKLVKDHLTPKSHQRIDSIIEVFTDQNVLDKVFTAGADYHHHLSQISKAFEKVVEADW